MTSKGNRADSSGNFLGAMSDKVASGSDDGNFFVWDKISGRLEGIWEGDGDTVNGEPQCLGSHVLRTDADGAVMEQHPTLPLVAVSGIDNTIKVRYHGFGLNPTEISI